MFKFRLDVSFVINFMTRERIGGIKYPRNNILVIWMKFNILANVGLTKRRPVVNFNLNLFNISMLQSYWNKGKETDVVIRRHYYFIAILHDMKSIEKLSCDVRIRNSLYVNMTILLSRKQGLNYEQNIYFGNILSFDWI